MDKAVIAGALRHVIGYFGGMVVAAGVLTAEEAEIVAGIVMGVFALAWSVIAKRRVKSAPPSALVALPLALLLLAGCAQYQAVRDATLEFVAEQLDAACEADHRGRSLLLDAINARATRALLILECDD